MPHKNLDKSELNDMTLVIPTFNRPDYLAQLLAYYRDMLAHSKVLVLDSSEPDVVSRNVQAVLDCGPRFRHVVFPASVPPAAKLAQGLELVDTAFCGFCADDDLVFVNGLRRALTFLRDNPEYVCVDGIYLNFRRVGRDVQLYIEYSRTGNASDYPGARIFGLFQKYESLFYGVYRTNDLCAIFAGVKNNPSLHFQELYQALTALMIGKSYRLPVFYAARQSCDPAEPTRDKWQTHYWFAENRIEMFEHYQAYREAVWMFYEGRGVEPRMSKDSFVHMMDLVHAMFFASGFSPTHIHSALKHHWPRDTYKAFDRDADDICNQLKSAWRRRLERGFQLAAKLPSRFSLGMPFALSSLNRMVKRTRRNNWNCVPVPSLRWLAGNKRFREAYIQLCTYLDHLPAHQIEDELDVAESTEQLSPAFLAGFSIQVNTAPLFESHEGWSPGYEKAVGNGPGVIVGPGADNPNVFGHQFPTKPNEQFRVIARAASVDSAKATGRIQINWAGQQGEFISVSSKTFTVTPKERTVNHIVLAPPETASGVLYVVADGQNNVVRYTEMRLLKSTQ